MFLKLVYLFFGVQVYFSVILLSGQRKKVAFCHFSDIVTKTSTEIELLS